MPKIKFAYQTLKNLKPNDKKRVDYFDNVTVGLFLRVNPSGKKTFYYRYYIGKHKNYKIGDFPAHSLSDVRQVCARMANMIALGEDPVEIKKQKQLESYQKVLFKDVAVRFISNRRNALKEITLIEYQRQIDKLITPKFGNIPISDISRRQVNEFLESIAVQTPTLANRLQALLSSIFSYALDAELVETNPIYRLKKKGKESTRSRILSDQEIILVWNEIDQQDEPIRSLFKMLLLCGQRSGETKRMKWKDIQDDKWVIPASEVKKSKHKAENHTVPLTDFSLSVLSEIKPLTGNTAYVFASKSNQITDEQPVKWLQKAIHRVKKNCDIPDIRIHDFRRTVASNLAMLKVSRTVIGKVLNHSEMAQDRSVTAIYDRYSYSSEKKEALNKWHNYLNALLEDS